MQRIIIIPSLIAGTAIIAVLLWKFKPSFQKCDGVLWGTHALEVPFSDPTPPEVTLNIFGEITASISSIDQIDKTFSLQGNEILRLVANGRDKESGVITSEIWYTEMWQTTFSDGTTITQGPGSVSLPAVKNADSDSQKTPGSNACNARNTPVLQLDISVQKKQATSYELVVWGRAINSFNQAKVTKMAVLRWN